MVDLVVAVTALGDCGDQSSRSGLALGQRRRVRALLIRGHGKLGKKNKRAAAKTRQKGRWGLFGNVICHFFGAHCQLLSVHREGQYSQQPFSLRAVQVVGTEKEIIGIPL